MNRLWNYFLTSLVCLLTCFAITPACAEVTVTHDEDSEEGLLIYRMTVTPAAEPVPALKHRFSTPLHLQKPGNAATHYLRSYGENNLSGPWKHVREKYGDAVDDWYRSNGVSIKDLPLEQVRDAARSFEGYVSNHIDPASRCRQCEWGLEEMDLRGMETIAYLLPDVQNSREISRALALLTRLAVAEHRYEDASNFLRMNYQLGQDIAEQRFLVCSLIGLAEVGVANGGVIDFIGAPESPNLYWALSELPHPIINMREAVDLEFSLGLRIYPALMDVETANHSPEEWSRLFYEMIDQFSQLEGSFGENAGQEDLPARLSATGFALAIYPAAKERLVQSGMTAEQVEAMSISQVLLIDTAREYQKFADQSAKWWYIDFENVPASAKRGYRRGKDISAGFGSILADLVLPAMYAARNAQMRVRWQMNALRAVEALRMHAAETGSLPTSLDEVTVVPVPNNPSTQQPYQYRLDGKTAVLDLPFSDGFPGVAWRFEIELAK